MPINVEINHHICHYYLFQVYVVVCSRTEPCKRIVKIEHDEKQFQEVEKGMHSNKEFIFEYPLVAPISCHNCVYICEYQ